MGTLARGQGSPFPSKWAQEDGNPRAKHSGEAGQLPYMPWLALIPLTSRVFLQSGISSALAQSNNPVKERVATKKQPISPCIVSRLPRAPRSPHDALQDIHGGASSGCPSVSCSWGRTALDELIKP